MSDQHTSYRQIVKATSLFGGVQAANILISVIRSKFIAVLLGTAGMGISGLLTSAIGLIGGLTNFGLTVSAVKNVAAAKSSDDQDRLAGTITVLKRWINITGILGLVVTIIFAPLLSRLTFGNSEFTFQFIWVSISLLFTQLCNGNLILLQGMRRLPQLAKANLAGSLLGLFITVPLYYLLGIKGIVPAIIFSSFTLLAASWYYARQIRVEKVSMTASQVISEGREMMTMGFIVSFSNLVYLGTSYLVRIFINDHGGLDQVGLYNAGFVIINTYVGLIFTAMATDYYPRLSSIAGSEAESGKVVNQQAEIAILIMAPVIILFIVFIRWIVIILYSRIFEAASEMIIWASLGMLFKAVSWAVAFLFLARGAGRLFFWSELAAQAYTLALNIIGYYYLGLKGLGIAFISGCLLYLIQVALITNRKFGFRIFRGVYYLFIIQYGLSLMAFSLSMLLGGIISYITGIFLFILSVSFSFNRLDKRLGLKILLSDLFVRYKKH